MTAKEATSSRRKPSGDKVPSRGSKPGERRGGRQRGTPNKVTADIRASIRKLLEDAAPKLAGWLEDVAKDNPAKALELALRAAEYAIPKLGRMDVNVQHGRLTLEELVAGVGAVLDEGGDPEQIAQFMYEAQPPLYVITGVPEPNPAPAEPRPPAQATPDPAPAPTEPAAAPETYAEKMARLSSSVPQREPVAPPPRADGPYHPFGD